MQCHRIEELLELLQPAWIKEQDLSLVQFVAKLAEEAGFDGPLSALTDDMLIYHLKMRESDKQAMIPAATSPAWNAEQERRAQPWKALRPRPPARC